MLVKPIVFLVSLAPFGWLVYATFTSRLGVNPAETLQLQTGIWALRFVMVTLAVTPLRRVTGWNRVIQYRRMLGLFAFFYATLHFLTYAVLDTGFAWDLIVDDVAKRPFITAGMVAFILMIPLALTSTRGAIRRLGRRWQQLHRLVYVSGIAAVVHYFWKVKADTTFPVRYAVLLALLFAVRLWWRRRRAHDSARAAMAG